MMTDKEIEDLIRGIDDGEDITNNAIFRIMVALNNRVKQLYQRTYNSCNGVKKVMALYKRCR